MNRSLISYLLGKTFLLCCKASSRETLSLGAKDFPFEDDPLTSEHLQGIAPLLLTAKFAWSWSIPWFYSSLSKTAAWTFPIRPAKFCWTKVQVGRLLTWGDEDTRTWAVQRCAQVAITHFVLVLLELFGSYFWRFPQVKNSTQKIICSNFYWQKLVIPIVNFLVDSLQTPHQGCVPCWWNKCSPGNTLGSHHYLLSILLSRQPL